MGSTNKIEELGGGFFDCFAGGAGECCFVACCPLCAYADGVEKSGVGSSCIVECCIAYVAPCFIPFRIIAINQKLGGTDDVAMRCVCCICCPHCQICQMRRAVENGVKSGLLKQGGGAPENVEEMTH